MFFTPLIKTIPNPEHTILSEFTARAKRRRQEARFQLSPFPMAHAFRPGLPIDPAKILEHLPQKGIE